MEVVEGDHLAGQGEHQVEPVVVAAGLPAADSTDSMPRSSGILHTLRKDLDPRNTEHTGRCSLSDFQLRELLAELDLSDSWRNEVQETAGHRTRHRNLRSFVYRARVADSRQSRRSLHVVAVAAP